MRVQRPIKTDEIIVDWRTVGPFMTNSFLVACPKTREAALVDASAQADTLLEMIAEHDVTIRLLLQTHAHLDHVGALAKMKEVTEAPIWIHEDEMELYDNVPMQCRLFGLPSLPSPPPPDRMIKEGETFTIGALSCEVLETPGHTPGGVSFQVNDTYLFSGDTLFAGSIGRHDLPGGDLQVLMRSLRRLCELPDDTLVFSGHGPVTSIGHEKKYNPFL